MNKRHVVLFKVIIQIESNTDTTLLPIKPWYHISKVKALIRYKWKVEFGYDVLTENQSLLFENTVLKDDRKVQHYDIQDGSILLIDYETITVIIQIASSTDSIYLPVKSWYHISKVKALIRYKWKVEFGYDVLTENQSLLFENTVLKDDRKVQHYDIQDGSILLIDYETITIFVHIDCDERTVSLEIKPFYTIIRVKESIQVEWKRAYNCTVLSETLEDKQYLEFNDIPLQDHFKASDYNIKNNDHLWIQHAMFNLTVETMSETDPQKFCNITVQKVKPWHTFKHFKEALYIAAGSDKSLKPEIFNLQAAFGNYKGSASEQLKTPFYRGLYNNDTAKLNERYYKNMRRYNDKPTKIYMFRKKGSKIANIQLWVNNVTRIGDKLKFELHDTLEVIRRFCYMFRSTRENIDAEPYNLVQFKNERRMYDFKRTLASYDFEDGERVDCYYL